LPSLNQKDVDGRHEAGHDVSANSVNSRARNPSSALPDIGARPLVVGAEALRAIGNAIITAVAGLSIAAAGITAAALVIDLAALIGDIAAVNHAAAVIPAVAIRIVLVAIIAAVIRPGGRDSNADTRHRPW